MVDEWTGDIVKELHLRRISHSALAQELGVSPQYVSMILTGKKKSAGMEQRMRDAIINLSKGTDEP